MRYLAAAAILILPAFDLAWNLTHLNIGLLDFYGLSAPAHGLVQNGAWPATPYFPAGYPLLLIPFALAGSALAGGYLLSYIGMAVALWALYRLLREWKLGRPLAILAIALAWLSPMVRITAGSPSVDALYTGFALWFLAAALALYSRAARSRQREPYAAASMPGSGMEVRPPLRSSAFNKVQADRSAPLPLTLPPWMLLGLILPAMLLPLLRYHALIILAPVLAVLWFYCSSSRRVLAWTWLALAAALSFNYGTYFTAYGRLPASVTGIQVRSGIEFDFHLVYENPAALYREYPFLSEYARNTPITMDYSPGLIAQHTLLSWARFLRRPPVALSLAAVLLLLLVRQRPPPGLAVAALWVACYTLVLSPAYYTPRSAALPVLVSIGVLLTAAALGLPKRMSRWGSGAERAAGSFLAAAVCLLLLGYAVASRSARADFKERAHYAQLSSEVAAYLESSGFEARDVVVAEARIIRRSGDPWSLGYPRLELGWLADPAIRPGQISGLTTYDARKLARGEGDLPSAILCRDPPSSPAVGRIAQSGYWQRVASIGEFQVLAPRLDAP